MACITVFKAGGDVNLAKKQGLGVILYYTGMGLANNFIDSFVKQKYGIDINMRYKNQKGEIRKVFESVDFTRWDLLSEEDWNKMGDKLGIPRDIPDRDTTIKAEVNKILVRARAWKLVLGATFAATGVGFIAKSDAWKTLLTNKAAIAESFKNVFTKLKPAAETVNNAGAMKQIGSRIVNFGKQLGITFKTQFIDNFIKAAKELPKSKLGKGFAAACIILPIVALINLIASPNRKRVYLSKAEAMPFATKVSNDALLREQLASKINPNNKDYEELYNKLAQNPVPANTVAPNTQVAQTNTAPTPFDWFEQHMRMGV